MDILEIIEPHLETIISLLAGAIAGGLVALTGKTKTDIDDKLLDAVADKLKQKEDA